VSLASRLARNSIRPNDKLEITTVGEPDLSGWSVVEADGSIIFPLIGVVQATGLTSTELQQMLTKKLNSFVRNPLVKVEIKTGSSIRRYTRVNGCHRPARTHTPSQSLTQ